MSSPTPVAPAAALRDKGLAWLDPSPLLALAGSNDDRAVRRAIDCDDPGARELAVLLSPAASRRLEAMAQRARALTRRHFGRTISIYAPLYLSSYCSGGCVYCGYASDRDVPRHRLEIDEVDLELTAMKQMGFDEVLLLTGERTREAGLDYLSDCVSLAAEGFHNVTIETFPMTAREYGQLAVAGCAGVTLYQETYDPIRYEQLHRWGPKRDYDARLDSPARALAGGIRFLGMGALLGLSDPIFDLLCLYRHVQHLRRRFWRAGIGVSFPRIRPQAGGYDAEFPVDDRFLAQAIWAFRICLPDVPLVLSTRERPRFRDAMAGVGISKMSAASRTTVGGYDHAVADDGQFDVSDTRDVRAFCAMLCASGLQPVFKNWDGVYREPAAPRGART